uniref:Capsid protein n=1 Tax=Porcine associated porprismacovirus TaxID=2496634 RepID=A0A482JT49_9VIRU|nr:capsid protein [Porcine associated porprismacovirus]
MVFTYRIQKWSDIETSTTGITMLNIGVSGTEILHRCQPFLSAFKRYRVVGVKVSLIPASTLPADPSQISFETGENSVNPSDMMNVGLIRYTNGEAFPYYKELTQTVSAGADFAETGMQTYFNMMMDRRWSKFGLQRGVSRFFRPKIYDDGLPIQSICPDENISFIKSDNNTYTVKNYQMYPWLDSTNNPNASVSFRNGDQPPLGTAGNGIFGTSNSWRVQSGRLKNLGWMATDTAHVGQYITGANQPIGDGDSRLVGFNTFPFINMGRIILPRAMKTKFAFRVVETIIVQFREPVNISLQNASHLRYLADRGLYTSGDIPTTPQEVKPTPFVGGNQI